MIQPSPTAPAGAVRTLHEYTPQDFQSSSAILCRNTAPLISFAFALIRKGVGCRVLGRDFGANLIDLIERTKASSVSELLTSLERMRERELGQAMRRGNLSAAGAIEDKYECLQLFTANATSVGDITSKIASIFDDKTSGLLTLSTIHKSKGLEWPEVFILDRQLCPSRYAKADWELQQERNLMYVAITRAKHTLTYIQSGNWKATTPVLQP